MEDNADAVRSFIRIAPPKTILSGILGRLCRFGFCLVYPDTIKGWFY
jgi:hypothetical protein